jgi:hypothetical protein
MTTLLMSSRYTDDDQALWRVAVQRGWTVERVRGIRVPELADDELVIYVERSGCRARGRVSRNFSIASWKRRRSRAASRLS